MMMIGEKTRGIEEEDMCLIHDHNHSLLHFLSRWDDGSVTDYLLQKYGCPNVDAHQLVFTNFVICLLIFFCFIHRLKDCPTPLMFAVTMGEIGMIDVLLRWGANPRLDTSTITSTNVLKY